MIGDWRLRLANGSTTTAMVLSENHSGEGRRKGVGILNDVVLYPHLRAAKRENERVTIVDRYPKLFDIGIDDNTGMIIRDGIGMVSGTGRRDGAHIAASPVRYSAKA